MIRSLVVFISVATAEAYAPAPPEQMVGMSCLQDISRMQEVRRTQGWPCGTAGPFDFWLGDGYLALGRLADAQRCAQDRLDAPHIGYTRPLGLYLLAEIAPARGVHAIVASIDSENTPSIVLFERFGYVEAARLREIGRKFDRRRTQLLLWKGF
jgi:hypothetical protein